MAGSTGKQLNQINQRINLTVNTAQARQQLQGLYTQLNSITKGTNLSNGLGITNELIEANKAAAQLKVTLSEALNPNTGNLNLTAFSDQLRVQNMSLAQYREQLANLGSVGDRAFTSLAKSIVTAEAPITRLGKWGQELTTTLGNTVRWQLTSSLLHGVMSTASQAMNYVKNLDSSLNSIRIVTGQSDEQMQRFARTANEAAKALNTTTNAYAQASLIYYQQGLSDKQVQERTAATIKLANVSGQTAAKVSDQMTAVWNNFYDGSKSLEYYIDVMTALGASTASSTDEISKGLEKFASIAQTTGLSYEYATSALATVTAATRQSADTVGTSFKTLFSRLQGLSLGETLDDGTTLNKYSKALNTIGVNIKNANGSLKDMDDILDEIGERWASLTKAEQVALAQTVGGARNYTGLVSLMDNWDSFQVNLKTAQQAQGTLQKQADIYAESWDAASKHVRTASETIYKNLLDDKFFKGLTNGFGDILDVIGAATNAMGGFRGVMALAASFATTKFAPQISQGIADIGLTLYGATPMGRSKVEGLRQEAINTLIKPTNNNGTQLGLVEQQYGVNLANRSTAYLTATKQGRIQSWQQPIFQQIMQQVADQETRSLQSQETANILKKQGVLESRTTQAAISQAYGGPKELAQYNFKPSSIKNGVRQLGTFEKLYNANLRFAIGAQHGLNLEAALMPFTLNEGISLNDTQQAIGAIESLSKIAASDKNAQGSVSKLITGKTNSSLDSYISKIVSQYQKVGGKLTEANVKGFQTYLTAHAQEFGVLLEKNTISKEYIQQQMKERLISAFGEEEGKERYNELQKSINKQGLALASGQTQHQNSLKAHEKVANMIKGSQGTITMSGAFTSAASAATTVTYTYLQAANAVKIFGDETSTTKDKLGALVSIGMTLPNSMNAVFGEHGILQSFTKTLKGTNISGGLASLVLAATVAGGVYLNNQYKERYQTQTLGYQSQIAQQQSVNAQQVASAAQENYDNFIALSNNQLKSQQEIYNNITGSSNQMLAIIKANQDAMDIINKYNLSSDQWSIGSFGEIQISSAVRNQIEKEVLNESKEASNNQLISNLTASLVGALNTQNQMTNGMLYRQSALELGRYKAAMLPMGVSGDNITMSEHIAQFRKFQQQNPGATYEDFIKITGLDKEVAQTNVLPRDQIGDSFLDFASYLWGVGKEAVVNLVSGKRVSNQAAEYLGIASNSSYETIEQEIDNYELSLENNKLAIQNYTQGLISAVQSNNNVYSQEIKDLASITLSEKLDINESQKLYEEAIKDLKKDTKVTDEQALYRQLYNPTTLDYLSWDKDTIQGQIIAKRLSISIQQQLDNIYKDIEEEGKIFKGYNLSSRTDLTSLLASNATNRYANLIREKQLIADRSLYEALVAQMPVNSFNTDLNNFENWLAEQNMSIQTQQQLESYIIDFGTTFGQETVKWVYDNFTGEEYSKEFRTSFREALDKTDLTGGVISNLYNLRRTGRSYADTGSDALIRKNLNTLYEKAIKDLGGDAGLLNSLLNSSEFTSVLDKLTSSFQLTGQLTADSIQTAAAKSEVLSQFLNISNINTGGLATVIRELSSGNLNINQISTPLLQAFSTAAAPESQRIRGISALTDFDYADSIESAFTQYFKDTKKAISPGWYGGVFYDAPINQFLNQMSTSNQEKYRANVTRMINEGWTTQQFQNQLKVDAPELYSYIEKVTSKKGADEFDMFDIMNSENAFNGPMIYDSKTGQLRYNTDYWKDNQEAETEYAKWFKENEYKDLVNSDETLKNLGTTQRAIQAMMAYQFRHVYSGAEADRKAEYIATYMHDAGNGPMWDKNAAIQGAKDLANSGLIFDDQYRAYFNENAALLGYEPTEEGYQKFVSDYFQVQTTTSASNIPGTNIPRGTTQITQRIAPVSREALKNITNLEDLNNILAGHIAGVLNGGSGLDTLLQLNGAILDENGLLDYDKTRQILEEQLELDQAQIDQIIKDKITNGSAFSKQIYDSATGTYKPIKTSEFQTAEDITGLSGFNNAITDAENADQLRYRQEERDWQLQKELAILGDAKDERSLSSRKALFGMLSPEEQKKYILQHPEAENWPSAGQEKGQSDITEDIPKTTAEKLEEARTAAAEMATRYNNAILNGASTEDLATLQNAKEHAEAQVTAYEKQLLEESPSITADVAAKARQKVLDERIAATANMTDAEKQDYYYKLIEQEKEGKGEPGPAVASTEEGLYYQQQYDFEHMSDADKETYYQNLLNDFNNQIPLSTFEQEILDTFQSKIAETSAGEGRFWEELTKDEKVNLVEALTQDNIKDVWNAADDNMKQELWELMSENQKNELQAQQSQTQGTDLFASTPEEFQRLQQQQAYQQFSYNMLQAGNADAFITSDATLEEKKQSRILRGESVAALQDLIAAEATGEDVSEYQQKYNDAKEKADLYAYQNIMSPAERLAAITDAQTLLHTQGEDKLTPFQKFLMNSIGEIVDYQGIMADATETEEEGKAKAKKAQVNEEGELVNEEGKPIELPQNQQPQGGGNSGNNGSGGNYGGNIGERGSAKTGADLNQTNRNQLVKLLQADPTGTAASRAGYSDDVIADGLTALAGVKDATTKHDAAGQNNARLLAYASGKEGHIAVTGELGPELRVKSDGSMDILGKTGREYAWIEPDDRIYTASQSAGILKSNKIPGLERLAKGINNFIPKYADGQTYVGTPGRPSGSGGGSSGRGGPSGGGASGEKDPRYDPNTLKIRDILERYYTILQQVDDITKAVEHIGKAIDRGWGQERIKNLERQEKLLESQYKMQEAYVKEIKDYLEVDKNALTTMVTDFVKEYNEGKNDTDKINLAGAIFDENGVLTNYKDIVDKLVSAYNKNAEANAQNKEEQYKFQERLKDIQMYTDTLNQLQEAEEKLYDLNNQILDTRIRQITYRIEYENEMDANDLKLVNFQYDQIADNAYRTAEAIDLTAQKSSYLADELHRYENGITEILGKYFDRDLTDKLVKMFYENPTQFAKEWQKIMETDPRYQDITDEHKNTLEGWMDRSIEIVKTLWDNYDKTIDKMSDDIKTFSKTLDGVLDKFDYFNSVYDSLNNIIGLTNRSLTNIDAAFMKTLSDRQLENSMNKFRGAAKEVQTMNKAMAEATLVYNTALAEQINYTGDDQYTKDRLQDEVDNAKKALDIVIEQNENATKQFYDAWENCLKAIEERYKVAMQEVGRDYERSISPYFMTLELLQNQYDREKELADLYVKDYQRIHDLSKLNRDIQKSIDDTDNLKGKQRLRDLQKEINDLQENGNDLSEYDLDILQKKYDLELARQALEDAKDAKSLVRLTRDNNGNWSYVYTSNQDDVDEAEQNYEDKIRDMEQANEDYIQEMQDQIVNLTAQARQALEGLNPADFASPEEFRKYLDNLIKYYQDRLDFTTSQLNNAAGNNVALAPDIQRMYNNLDHNLTTNPGQTILSAMFGTQNFDDAIGNIMDGINNMAGEALKTYATIYSEMQKEVYEIAGIDIANAASGLGDIIDIIAKASAQQVDVMDKEATRIDDAYTDTINAIQAYQASLADLIGETNTMTNSLSSLNTFLHSSGEYVPTNTLYEKFQTAYKNVAGFNSGGYTGRWQYADTGMYTGEWPDGSSRRNGRLAWLHQKGLVLNAHDTENFLDAMQIVRQLDNLTNWMANGLGDLMMPRVSSTEGELNQNVHIEAEFPNVTDHNEIEQAFGNLVNMASQYANRK